MKAPNVVSPFVLRRIYAEARRAVIRPGNGAGVHSDPWTEAQVLANQGPLRRVQAEYLRRLKRAGIAVEGA